MQQSHVMKSAASQDPKVGEGLCGAHTLLNGLAYHFLSAGFFQRLLDTFLRSLLGDDENAVQIAEELVRRDLLGVKDRTVFIKK